MQNNWLTKTLFLLTVISLFSFSHARAQQAKMADDLVGVWEVHKKHQFGPYKLIVFRYLKIINKDGSFIHLNLNSESSFISHKGTFRATDDGVYYEQISKHDGKYFGTELDKEQKLNYRFSEDKKTLFLTGTLKGEGKEFELKEEWKKIEMKSESKE